MVIIKSENGMLSWDNVDACGAPLGLCDGLKTIKLGDEVDFIVGSKDWTDEDGDSLVFVGKGDGPLDGDAFDVTTGIFEGSSDSCRLGDEVKVVLTVGIEDFSLDGDELFCRIGVTDGLSEICRVGDEEALIVGIGDCSLDGDALDCTIGTTGRLSDSCRLGDRDGVNVEASIGFKLGIVEG